jgi:hypothetical protein
MKKMNIMTPMMTIHEELEFTAINLEFLAAELMAGCLLGSTVGWAYGYMLPAISRVWYSTGRNTCYYAPDLRFSDLVGFKVYSQWM